MLRENLWQRQRQRTKDYLNGYTNQISVPPTPTTATSSRKGWSSLRSAQWRATGYLYFLSDVGRETKKHADGRTQYERSQHGLCRTRRRRSRHRAAMTPVCCGSLAFVRSPMPACLYRPRRCTALFFWSPRLQPTCSEEFTPLQHGGVHSVLRSGREATELCPHRLASRSSTLYLSVVWDETQTGYRRRRQYERSHTQKVLVLFQCLRLMSMSKFYILPFSFFTFHSFYFVFYIFYFLIFLSIFFKMYIFWYLNIIFLIYIYIYIYLYIFIYT